MLLLPESDLELRRKDIEKFLIFPMAICTPLYDKWFRSYGFLMLIGLQKLCPGQNRVSCEIQTFPSKSNAISGNVQNQHRSQLF
jgi:hypothetical protein